MIEDAIRTKLLDDPRVTAMIGSGNRARLWPVHLPQREKPDWPAITYQIISGRPAYHIDAVAGLAEMRLQIDVWSAERPGLPVGAQAYDEVRLLAEYVRMSLSGYHAAVNGTGYALQSCFLENRRSLYDDATQTHRESMDFILAYAEA